MVVPPVPVFNAPCINTGDTTWVLVSTILVLSMFGGLAFFEAGLLRSKNTQSVIMQVLAGAVVLGFMWDLFGYSLALGKDHGRFIGDFSNGLLFGVSYNECSPHAPTIPAALYALFMMMFAAITPLLMTGTGHRIIRGNDGKGTKKFLPFVIFNTGSIAERISWRAYFILIIVWEIIVYYPLAHWVVRDGCRLSQTFCSFMRSNPDISKLICLFGFPSQWGDGWLQHMGVQDFAGGIVIHTSAGAGSLVLSIMLGRRVQFDKYHGEFPPSNLPLAAIGTCMLWAGWFGFNAGSALSAGAVATGALVSTQLAALTSGTVWLIASWIRNKPSSMAIMIGVVAGLAGITPASGYINDPSTLVIALIIGVCSYVSMWLVKIKFRIDDALDVVSVHGLPGIIGSLSIGFCASEAVDPSSANGLIFGGSAYLLGVQTLGVVIAIVWAGFWTFVISFILSKTIGLRVSEEEEDVGLDVASHGEYAYHNLWMMEGSEKRRVTINPHTGQMNVHSSEITPLISPNDISEQLYDTV